MAALGVFRQLSSNFGNRLSSTLSNLGSRTGNVLNTVADVASKAGEVAKAVSPIASAINPMAGAAVNAAAEGLTVGSGVARQMASPLLK